jgi:predicted MFS family arabinose efflux permease
MAFLQQLSAHARQYVLITANYWAFTLTDGALRMLVVLHFHQLGYSPLDIALLFLFYELFGVITNLVGGWLGARLGLNQTMNIGLLLQLFALAMLCLPSHYLSIAWVMTAQALSGIAKDLNKMSAKSAIKLLVPDQQQGKLYHWVALLTGSKNTLKGVGFFLGGALLTLLGFRAAIMALFSLLLLSAIISLLFLQKDFGKSVHKAKFKQLFSKSPAINRLSAARLFLFAARDVWFVVALPVYLTSELGWAHSQIGAFLAGWIILYGLIQSIAPKITGAQPDGTQAALYAGLLSLIPVAISAALLVGWYPQACLFTGLLLFAFSFAINSSLHSFLIVHYANREGVSLDIGFYYMANAMGRLIGTVLSGWLCQTQGIESCLLVSGFMLICAALLSIKLPRHPNNQSLTGSL